jgi:hypothetical protein
MKACPLPLWKESASRKSPVLTFEVEAVAAVVGKPSFTVLLINKGESSHQPMGRATTMTITPRTFHLVFMRAMGLSFLAIIKQPKISDDRLNYDFDSFQTDLVSRKLSLSRIFRDLRVPSNP